MAFLIVPSCQYLNSLGASAYVPEVNGAKTLLMALTGKRKPAFPLILSDLLSCQPDQAPRKEQWHRPENKASGFVPRQVKLSLHLRPRPNSSYS